MKKITLLLSTLLLITEAQASGGISAPTNVNAKWKSECSACHVAYPAQLLPVASWDAIMKNLDKHFGSDASIDAASTAEILAYLNTNASHRKFETTTKPILRITETRWFQSQHDEVPNRLWKDPRVKSASNCAACHTKADSGNFNERFVHLPR